MTDALADKPLLKPYIQAFPEGYRIDADALRALAAEKPVYIIAIQPRTGSTWLTEMAVATGKLGHPHELLGEAFVLRDEPHLDCRPPRMRGVADIDAYIRDIHADAGGAAGVQMTYHHLVAMRDLMKGTAPIADITWFYLRRRDVLEQAISIARSLHTGIWHSLQLTGEEGDIGVPPLADCVAWVEKIVGNETRMEELLAGCGVVPSRLFYEGLQNNPLGFLQRIAWTVGVPIPEELPSTTLRILRDSRTQDLKRGLARDPAVRDILARRPALVPDP